MADLAKRLSGPGLLSTAATTLYTVPASTQTILRSIHVVNVSSSAASNLTLSIGVNATSTQLFNAYVIPANGVFDWSGFIVLNAADVVQALGSVTNTLNITMSGVEVT